MADEETTEEETESKPKSSRKKKASHGKEVTKLAESVLDGSGGWGTGRERDEQLRAAGHDPDEVRAEVVRLRGERAREEAAAATNLIASRRNR
jgi:hypothetical protein